ncbi:GerAB/ArcD/ProY family transporter [Paenibacillus sp. NEAU-GSW1]|nr:GerAB/ArcD/ProY family transporter [Paenibacillus sp. NEAU-GSW1]
MRHGGLALLLLMLDLIRLYPGQSFIEICRWTVGNWLTYAVAGFMLTMAFHMASGILIDVAGFMTSIMLPETPIYIFTGLIFIVTELLLRSGIETIARMFNILIVIILFFWAIVILLLIRIIIRNFFSRCFPKG